MSFLSLCLLLFGLSTPAMSAENFNFSKNLSIKGEFSASSLFTILLELQSMFNCGNLFQLNPTDVYLKFKNIMDESKSMLSQTSVSNEKNSDFTNILQQMAQFVFSTLSLPRLLSNISNISFISTLRHSFVSFIASLCHYDSKSPFFFSCHYILSMCRDLLLSLEDELSNKKILTCYPVTKFTSTNIDFNSSTSNKQSGVLSRMVMSRAALSFDLSNFSEYLKIIVTIWEQREMERKELAQKPKFLVTQTYDDDVSFEKQELLQVVNTVFNYNYIENESETDGTTPEEEINLPPLLTDDDLKQLIFFNTLLTSPRCTCKKSNVGQSLVPICFDCFGHVLPDCDVQFYFNSMSSFFEHFDDVSIDSSSALGMLSFFNQMFNTSNVISDLWKDSSPDELQKLYTATKKVFDRVEELLMEYPDNQILQNLKTLCVQVLDLPVTVTLIEMLKFGQSLLDSCLEWDLISPKFLKFSDYVVDAAQLCHKWRKLELEQFRLILGRRMNQKQLSSLPLFFHLVKSLLSSPDDVSTDYLKSFVENLHHFLDSSSLFDFELRLKLLILMGNYLTKLSYNSNLTNALFSLVESRKLFVDRLTYIIKRNSQPIITQLNEFLTVHSAVLSDPVKIKYQMGKTLRQLAKCVSKFDNVLNIPFSQVVQQIDNISTSYLTSSSVTPKPLADLLPSQFNKSNVLIQKSLEIDEFIFDLIQQSTELSKVPESKDLNIVSIKQRAVSSLFTQLKQFSLCRKNFEIFEIMSSFPSNSLTNDLYFKKSENYFWICLRRLRLLQSRPHHDDVTRYVGQYLDYLQNLFNTCAAIRLTLSEFLAHVSGFDTNSSSSEPLELIPLSILKINDVVENLNGVLSLCQQLDLIELSNICDLSVFTDLKEFTRSAVSIVTSNKFRNFKFVSVSTLSSIKFDSLVISLTRAAQSLPELDSLSVFKSKFLDFSNFFSSFRHFLSNLPSSVETQLPNLPIISTFTTTSSLLSTIGEVTSSISPIISSSKPIKFDYNDCSTFFSSCTELSTSLFYFFRSYTKLCYILLGIFLELSSKGFCRPQEEQEEEDMEQEQEGMGLGEGETSANAKDVSDELENKEQIMGLEGEDQNEEDNQNQDTSNTGFDLEDDFNGTTSSVKEEEEQKEEEEEPESKEVEDDEIGEVDQEEDRVEGKNDEEDQNDTSSKEESGGKAESNEIELGAKDEDKSNEPDTEEGNEPNEEEAKEEEREEEFDEDGVDHEHELEDNVNEDSVDHLPNLPDEIDDIQSDENLSEFDGSDIDGDHDSDLEGDEEIDPGQTEMQSDHDSDHDSEMESESIPINQGLDGQEGQVNEELKSASSTQNQEKDGDQEADGDDANEAQVDQSNQSNMTDSGKGDGSNGDQNSLDSERQIVDDATNLMRNLEIISQNNRTSEETEAMEDEEAESSDLFEFSNESKLGANAAAMEEQKDSVRKEEIPEASEEKDIDDVPKKDQNQTDQQKSSDSSVQKKDTTKELTEEEVMFETNTMDEELTESSLIDSRPSVATFSKEFSNETEIDPDLLNSVDSELQDSEIFNSFEEEAIKVWSRHARSTSSFSLILAEKFRLILEPTLAAKLKGDFKSGKRLNMKKIIPFIASNFKRDAIWLRRSQPSKRNYQVLFAIDDSKSMNLFNASSIAISTLVLMLNALSLAEIGEFAVFSFGQDTRVSLPLTSVITDELGSQMLSRFSFDQNLTNVFGMMQQILSYVENNEASDDSVRLLFILSDGRFSNQSDVELAVRLAHQRRILTVFLIMDNPNVKDSILNLKSVTYPNGKLHVESYLDSFPYPYYLIVKDFDSLPDIIATSLQQWLAATT
ncbi:hypothetical protein GEMRC1_008596 [Eukaryota sp. GEM-RC1]